MTNEFNSRPVWLINPDTGERLEFDCYFPHRRLALEFNGAQHYGPTRKYPGQEAFQKRLARDLYKLRQTMRREVTVIIIRTEDLCVDVIREKLRPLVPLHDLPPGDPILAYLDRLCSDYQEAARRDAEVPVNAVE